ncbi:hypothetical protein GQ457_12G019580 [Hibiscus cannabinus]
MVPEVFDTMNSVDWENLPDLCLLKIFDKINVPQVQLSAVSKRWYTLFNTFLDHRRRSSTNMIPLLLIPSKKSSTKGKLYSLQSKSKVSEIELPKLHTWRFCGSCYGWLATVDQGGIITLSNPFRKACSINLPRIDTKIFGILEYQFTVPKVVLSEDPLLYPDNYVVTIIYVPCYKLAVYKSGQKDWVYINRDDLKEWGFTDIISHKNFVYAIRPMNIMLSFDVNGFGYDGTSKSPKWNTLLGDEDNDEPDWSNQIYLVKSSMGNLYSIHKYLDIDAHSTKRFDVFKLIFDEENGNLLGKKEVHHIDGDIVFVGDNKTLAVSALDFPEGQPNSIYFTDDYFYNAYEPFGPRDIGIFHLKDKSFGKYYQFKSSHKDLPPYIWIWPPVDFKPTLKKQTTTGFVRKLQGFASEFAYAIQSCRDNQCIECILAVSKLLFMLQHKRRVARSIKRWLGKTAESSPMEPLSKRTRPVLHHAIKAGDANGWGQTG